ncbi:hypothetical protein CLV31_11012 [Algoriphagus aquaeductus]|uniref:Uncharacterized protein n=1 Tax=Algoriphagus aquaeductus TaxID=475299 RepID=A0A326RNT1_9BACT|nr:hypothetical protein [Algoriphagus aquaeductus]PZV81481.1 hypothetical protein CLV31_11012 [Algoriphagus aquaeductus]
MISKGTVLYSGYQAEKEKLAGNLMDILQKIKSFSTLGKGWHYGEGQGPSLATLGLAERIAKRLHLELFCKIDAFPGIWGEIQVTAYLQEYFIEINILSDGSIEFLVEDQNQNIVLELEGLNFDGLVTKIKFFKGQYLWKSFVYFPQTISIKTYPDSPVLPSGILLVQEEESPYLTEIAHSETQAAHVAILTPITKRSAINPRYFGNSVQTNYQIIPS